MSQSSMVALFMVLIVILAMGVIILNLQSRTAIKESVIQKVSAGLAIAVIVLASGFWASSGAMVTTKEVFDKIKVVEPQMTQNQVVRSNLSPDLFEVYSQGRMRYVLGDHYLVKGEIYDLNNGENLTEKKLNAYRAISEPDSGGAMASAMAQVPANSHSTVSQGMSSQAPSTPTVDPSSERSAVTGKSDDPVGEGTLKTGDIKKPKDLNATLATLANDVIPDEMTVVYPAQGKKLHQVTVFSDVTCPVCRRNHQDYGEFQKKGVTIRVALFPRRGMDAPEAEVMGKVMCAADMSDRRKLLDRAFGGDSLDDSPMCDNGYVKNIRNIAVSTQSGLSVVSTPTLMSANGVRVDGYPKDKPVDTVLDMLNKADKEP